MSPSPKEILCGMSCQSQQALSTPGIHHLHTSMSLLTSRIWQWLLLACGQWRMHIAFWTLVTVSQLITSHLPETFTQTAQLQNIWRSVVLKGRTSTHMVAEEEMMRSWLGEPLPTFVLWTSSWRVRLDPRQSMFHPGRSLQFLMLLWYIILAHIFYSSDTSYIYSLVTSNFPFPPILFGACHRNTRMKGMTLLSWLVPSTGVEALGIGLQRAQCCK